MGVTAVGDLYSRSWVERVLGNEPLGESVRVIRDPREEVEWLHAEVLDDPAGGARYLLVRTADVDARVASAARAGLKFAAAHLGVAPPALAFFRLEGSAEAWYRHTFGSADWPSYRGRRGRLGHAAVALRSIAVSAEVPPTLAAEIAAHEVFHLAFAGRDERDARAYGAYAAAVLTMRGLVARVLVDNEHLDARPGDVRVTADREVLWNLGSVGAHDWQRPYVRCPVDLGEQ